MIPSRTLNCASIQVEMASGVVLQVDRIKQHLRIKAFYGTSDNAVKIQVWIAISTYVVRIGRSKD